MAIPFRKIYLFGLHAAVISLAIVSDFPAKSLARLGIVEPPPRPHVSTMAEINEWRDMTVPEGSVIFLGDSITERMATNAVDGNSVNLGISRQTTQDLIDNMPSAVAKASKVYLMVGVNDILQNKQDGLNARLGSINAALIDRPTVWTGIMSDKAIYNNTEIKRLCESRPNCTYIEPIIGRDNFVDGVHLNKDGYSKWIRAMKSTQRIRQ